MQTERYQQVKAVLFKRGFGPYIDQKTSQETYKQSPAKRFRLALEELGGGFILLGQLLKFRIDLIPTSYCKALHTLRDKGIPISYTEFRTTLAKQYSRPLETIFATIKKKPYVVDVLSQTHQATLTNGEDVFVKIIKPNAKEQIKEDITILHYLAKKIALPINATHIIAELKQYSKQKSDLRLEETFLEQSGKYASEFTLQAISSLSQKNVLVSKQIKRKTIEHMRAQVAKLEEDVHFIQGEFLISFIGLLLLGIGVFLSPPFNRLFLYLSIACFILVFIFLTQHPK